MKSTEIVMRTLEQFRATGFTNRNEKSGTNNIAKKMIFQDFSLYSLPPVHLESKFREKAISMPLLFGENSLLQSLGVKSFPTYWLVTPGRHVEVIHGDINEVKKVLEKVFKD